MFDIGLPEVCVRVGVHYVITKFSQMNSLPNFVTHGAPLRALSTRESSAIQVKQQTYGEQESRHDFSFRFFLIDRNVDPRNRNL